MRHDSEIARLFVRGDYKEVLERAVEGDVAVDAGDAPYAIGALSFVGRVDDARLVEERHRKALTAEGRAAARFFLGIGYTRVSRYAEARAVFGANLLALRRSPRMSERARFFVHQGLAFYRYFLCRYAQALAAARSAWEAAFGAGYRYGQVLAADLRGHALVHAGEVSSGLKSLEDASRLADKLGNGGIKHAIAISTATYRAGHGLDGDDAIQKLKALLESLPEQDSYSHSMLCLELARQCTLRGDIERSEGWLAKAGRIIYASGHRRQRATLNHRYAFNRHLMGQDAAALDLLAQADAWLDPAVDLGRRLEILGLRARIAGRAAEATLRQDIAALTLRTGAGVARNVLARAKGEGGVSVRITPTARGEDVVGDTKTLTALGRATGLDAVEAVVRSGWVELLHDVVTMPAGARALVFDLVPGRLAIFDRGSVVVRGEGTSRTLKLFAKTLAGGPATKKELIERIWGYDYHALRHDPLLYAMATRLRRALGERADWLVATEGGYGFPSDVRVAVHEHQVPLAAAPGDRASKDAPEAALNHRQLTVLQLLQADGGFIGAADCVRRFGVSRITAVRDLGQLVALGRLRRLGQGRATRYGL